MKNGGTVALTGGIGSGKSQALRLLKKLGYTVFSCDEIYKELSSDEKYLRELKKIFPLVVEDNGLNRKKLAEIVFSDEEQLKLLNDFSHPKIMKELGKKLKAISDPLKFAEVPILFERGYEKKFDYVIVVIRPLNERINSVRLRDALSEEEVLKRIDKQYDYSKFLNQKRNADNIYILENDGKLEDIEQKLIKIIHQIQS